MKINSQNCIVCYLDVLGYEALVNSDKKPEDVFNVFKEALDFIEKNKEKYSGPRILDAVYIQILSDSIILTLDLEIVAKLEKDGIGMERSVGYFFHLISIFTINLTSKLQHLIRGGISVGPYF